jgi:hypothetical protein
VPSGFSKARSSRRPIEQVRHRCVLVGAIEQHAADDLDRRAQRHGIGGIPAGRVHGANNVALIADQRDVDGIARNALRGARHHRQFRQSALVLIMRPERGQHDIGKRGVAEQDREHDQQHALEPRMMMRAHMLIVVQLAHAFAFYSLSPPFAGRGLG